jgi:hypothetical protein
VHGYFKIPNGVFYHSERMLANARNEYEIYEVYRLFHHPHMEAVWKHLTAEKQGMPGVYLHPAVGGAISAGGPADAQQLACAKLFDYLFYVACNPIEVTKRSEEEENRKKVLADAAESRRVADRLAASGLVDPDANAAAAATLRQAQVEEERARRILAQMRTRDDLLVVDKDRGDDRRARAASILFGDKLHELFGKHLYGIAAILAEVALGKKVSKRAVRSAHGKKLAQLK